MKQHIVFLTLFLISTAILTSSPASGRDCAELYVKLTCHTCHGPEGRGMIRTETKEKYYLKKKAMYRKMVQEGMPVEKVMKLKPLYKKKFTDKEKFIQAVEELLGKEDTEKYIDTIIKIGGRVYYHKGDPIPGFETYPRHAGNQKIYLFQQMKDILENRRTNGNSEAMRGIQPYLENNNITDDDLMCIAEYLSNIKD